MSALLTVSHRSNLWSLVKSSTAPQHVKTDIEIHDYLMMTQFEMYVILTRPRIEQTAAADWPDITSQQPWRVHNATLRSNK